LHCCWHLTFFLLEKFVLWRHCHDDPCEMHAPSTRRRDAAVGPHDPGGRQLSQRARRVLVARRS